MAQGIKTLTVKPGCQRVVCFCFVLLLDRASQASLVEDDLELLFLLAAPLVL